MLAKPSAGKTGIMKIYARPSRVSLHHGRFVWKPFHNNVGIVWGFWTFRRHL